ncbi:hypothetical protein BaRGS_00004700 [Batillaria attramentaria]|uniref:Peroxisomal membrane protein PEX13 n=1 Tax=Batillaria attramentaria TaxID=370345 RepID=A0ABD0LY01_9CAEN
MAAPPKPWERAGVNQQSSTSVFENAMSSYGSYGTYGGMSSFGSPLGYGGMYSPYGGYGGYGSYGYNRFGTQGDPMGSTFARVAEENSRPAFQSIESIVQAVTSVSMMLDSSFQAVYSSFRAVIGVADNFSRLRSQLVQVFSALALIRTLRYIVRRFLELIRLRPSGEAEREWREAVAQAAGAIPVGGDGEPKKSSWPIFMFFGIILGGPWLIWKLISSFSNSSAEESWAKGEADHYVGQALYSFTGQGEEELSFSAGQQIILAPKELQPQVRGWLRGSVGGQKGLVPHNYVKVLGRRRGRQPAAASNTLANQSAIPSAPAQPLASGASPSTSSSQVDRLAPSFAQASASVADLDSVFSSSLQSSQTQTFGAEANMPVENQSSANLNASDILEKESGE